MKTIYVHIGDRFDGSAYWRCGPFYQNDPRVDQLLEKARKVGLVADCYTLDSFDTAMRWMEQLGVEE